VIPLLGARLLCKVVEALIGALHVSSLDGSNCSASADDLDLLGIAWSCGFNGIQFENFRGTIDAVRGAY